MRPDRCRHCGMAGFHLSECPVHPCAERREADTGPVADPDDYDLAPGDGELDELTAGVTVREVARG